MYLTIKNEFDKLMIKWKCNYFKIAVDKSPVPCLPRKIRAIRGIKRGLRICRTAKRYGKGSGCNYLCCDGGSASDIVYYRRSDNDCMPNKKIQ